MAISEGGGLAQTWRADASALVSPAADRLRTKNRIGLGINNELERQRFGTRVVTGMVHRVGVDDPNLATLVSQFAFRAADDRGRETEHPNDGGAERRHGRMRSSCDHIGREAAVAIGEPREPDRRWVTIEALLHDSITDGEDGGIRRALFGIDNDVATIVKVKASISCEGALGAHPDRKHDEIGRRGVGGVGEDAVDPAHGYLVSTARKRIRQSGG